MLDLKAKLASAGLISDADIKRVDSQKARHSGRKRRGPAGPSTPPKDHAGLPVAKLRDVKKAELYEAVRRWIKKARLDQDGSIPSETAAPFHFPEATGRVGRLRIEPTTAEALRSGQAGLVSYMSNNGLAHAVVPASGARAIAELMPAWLRVLEGDPRAGAIDKPASDPK